MLQSMRDAMQLPDLRRRILFTLGILAIYRLAAHIPVPGLNAAALRQLFEGGQGLDFLNFLNLLSGGTLRRFSVVMMGVYPYITASIILQLLIPIVPHLEELSKEGEQGRNTINRYTYWLTIPMAIFQGVAQVATVRAQGGGDTLLPFGATAPLNTITVLFTLVAGTMFALWLGERITESGIGNGISIIIFGGIVASIPENLFALIQEPVQLIVVLLVTLLTIYLIVFVQEGFRRIPVQYGKRVRGNKVYGGQSTYIPLRVNTAGMIPLIFASSLLVFPGVIGQFLSSTTGLPDLLRNFGTWLVQTFNGSGGSPAYYVFDFLLVVIFTFFYTDVVFRQQNLHESLQRNGGFIPGIRPGQRTETYLTSIMRRITFAGAVFLGSVAVLPFFIGILTGSARAGSSLVLTSTGLLIVVGVVLDTIKQLEAQMLMRHYEGFIK